MVVNEECEDERVCENVFESVRNVRVNKIGRKILLSSCPLNLSISLTYQTFKTPNPSISQDNNEKFVLFKNIIRRTPSAPTYTLSEFYIYPPSSFFSSEKVRV